MRTADILISEAYVIKNKHWNDITPPSVEYGKTVETLTNAVEEDPHIHVSVNVVIFQYDSVMSVFW